MPNLTQLAMGAVLVAAVAVAIVFFYQVLADKKGRGRVWKFLAIEASLYAAAAIALFLLTGPRHSLPGVLIGSLLLAMLANAPSL